MTTTELAAQLADNPRFRNHEPGLFTELAAIHGADFVGIAFIQACLKIDQDAGRQGLQVKTVSEEKDRDGQH